MYLQIMADTIKILLVIQVSRLNNIMDTVSKDRI